MYLYLCDPFSLICGDVRNLSKPGVYWVVVCALLIGGTALRAPALHANLWTDDWDQYAIEKGIYPVKIASWDMFRWVGNGAAELEALLRAGRVPWWSSRDLKLSVLRPLASLLAHLDYSTLDSAHHPDRLHIHTLLWWIFLMVGVASLMKQILPIPVALITVLIYAVDDCFIMPLSWAANRSTIITLAFVVWALRVYFCAQRVGSFRMRCAAFALVSVAFCAGEHALPPLAFLVAATFASPGTLRSRMRALIPPALIVAVYSSVRAFMGYGVAGSGFYIEPLAEPLRYIKACATRIPTLLAELVFSIPCEAPGGSPFPDWAGLENLLRQVASIGPQDSSNFVVGIVAGLMSIACVFWLRRKEARNDERTIAWLVVGALLALLPLAGTIAAGRMTPAPAIGFDALIAYLLWRCITAFKHEHSGWYRLRCGALAIIVISLAVFAPAQRSYAGAHYVNGMTNLERGWVETADFGVENLSGRHVYVLSARDLTSEMSIPYIMHAAGRAMPDSSTLLSPRGDSEQTLMRISDNAFELALSNPAQAPNSFNGSVYRADRDAMYAGLRVGSVEFEATVVETSSGQPTLLRFQFTRSLDDDHLIFMVAQKRKLSRLRMPRIGERVIIPPAQGP